LVKRGAVPIGRKPLEDSFITRIEVQDLFGLYSYILEEGSTSDGESRRLFLLYGDNGAGKTTVLQLVFNLLSQARNRDHRGYLARTPFRRLAVTLAGTTVVSVDRTTESLTGAYVIRVTKDNVVQVEAPIHVNEIGKVRGDQPSIEMYIRALSELNIDLYFLTDDRKGRSSFVDGSEPDDDDLALQTVYHRQIARAGRAYIGLEEQHRNEVTLERTIERFDAWIRNQALAGSTAGESNTNTVYVDIIKRIARPRKGRPAANERDLDELLVVLKDVEERNRSYAQYGLTSQLDAEPIVNAAHAASPATRRIIASVLGPYVDGIRARLNALETVQRLLDTFVENVNSFLKNKRAAFDPRSGLRFFSRNNELLAPGMLSSGERQLLLLLCNTVLARDDATIFLVDEPEISLNVKWQRTLLDALLRLTTDSPVQFVIATHSLELLTRHKSAVRQLIDQSSVEGN
jgi:energy-coupling factor transporter ATP-binding protein EcfA2